MKKILALPFLIALAVLFSTQAHAQTYPLGAEVAVKVDYFHFFSGDIGTINAKDGVYVGVSGYRQLLLPNLFLGMEIGWAGTSGTTAGTIDSPFVSGVVSADSTIDYVPIEFNAKYRLPFISPGWNLDVGGGFSINYFDYRATLSGTGGNAGPLLNRVAGGDTDWAWGGQFFGELNYKYQNWFLGVDLKYQLTQDLTLFGVDTGVSADNLRTGLHAGYSF